ncbi:MAG: ABC-2 family transporter protein [Oscillospiraceae bacterium]|nr:ABC-2 family transporter protein [Oscillospiraceae bacterium]
MKTIKHYLSVAWLSFRLSFQACMEYPAAFIGWLISNPIQFLVGFATIKFVVEEFQTLADWNFKELAFLYGMSVLSHGLSVIFFTKTWYMGWTIIHGEMDRLRLRPLNTLFQFLAEDMNFYGITDLIPGIILFIYGCIAVDFRWTLQNTVCMIAAVIGGTLIRGAIYLGFGSSCFWTKSPLNVSGFFQELFNRTNMYPLSMYPRAVQFVFTFILPISWITFYPAAEFMGKESMLSLPFGMAFITLGIGLVMFLIACRIFRAGFGQYESAGS